MRGLLRPNSKSPFEPLRQKIVFDFIELDKLRQQKFADLQASAAILPVAGAEGSRAFGDDMQIYKELLFAEKFFESIARSEAEKDGRSYLTSDQKDAVDRFLEFEKQGD